MLGEIFKRILEGTSDEIILKVSKGTQGGFLKVFLAKFLISYLVKYLRASIKIVYGIFEKIAKRIAGELLEKFSSNKYWRNPLIASQ